MFKIKDQSLLDVTLLDKSSDFAFTTNPSNVTDNNYSSILKSLNKRTDLGNTV